MCRGSWSALPAKGSAMPLAEKSKVNLVKFTSEWIGWAILKTVNRVILTRWPLRGVTQNLLRYVIRNLNSVQKCWCWDLKRKLTNGFLWYPRFRWISYSSLFWCRIWNPQCCSLGVFAVFSGIFNDFFKICTIMYHLIVLWYFINAKIKNILIFFLLCDFILDLMVTVKSLIFQVVNSFSH